MDKEKLKTSLRRASVLPFVALIKLYRITLSPYIGGQCRFTPTCSAYAIEAFERHGPLKGLYLTVYRLLRCNPLGGSGYDPVPEKFTLRPEKCRKRKT